MQSMINKDQLNGGGKKPASEKQIKLIFIKCYEQGIIPEELANDNSINFGNMTGYEANLLIKILRLNELIFE